MKYFKSFILSLLIAFSLGGVAHAETPLSKNEERIQQHSQEVESKNATLQMTAQEIQDLEKKKQELAQTLDNEKKTIEELKKKIEEKKAREAERARQVAIATQEQAQRASYVAPQVEPVRAYKPPQKRYASNSAGNTYYAGQCTWHVKNLKPELPNMLGNADRWFYNAKAQGWPVGYEARAGAAGQTKRGMHVVYVLEVYGNGTMLISEMNYNWTPYAQRTIVVNQANYLYIY